jgi:hypothetical protein
MTKKIYRLVDCMIVVALCWELFKRVIDSPSYTNEQWLVPAIVGIGYSFSFIKRCFRIAFEVIIARRLKRLYNIMYSEFANGFNDYDIDNIKKLLDVHGYDVTIQERRK